MFKMRHDSRGIATVAIIAIVVVVLAVGGVGWYIMQNKDDKTASVANSPAAEEAKSACDDALGDEEFCKFAANFNSLGSYKATLTTSGPDGNSVLEMEVDASGNSSIVTKEGGKETSAMIYLDKVSYLKNSTDNSWIKYDTGSATDQAPTDLSNDVNIDFDQSDIPEADQVKYNKIGEEDCGGSKCLKYEIVDPATPKSKQFVWFDTKDYQLRRWSSTEGGNTSDMVITYSEVKITAPSPVKEMNLDGPTEEELRQLQEQFSQ